MHPETDDQLRKRLLAEYDRQGLLPQHAMREAIQTRTGRDLDCIAAAFDVTRLDTASPNPFGDRITAELRRADETILHPVQRVEEKTDIDALWRSVEEYGRGG